MTPQELRELAEKATPGPWYALQDSYDDGTWFITADPSRTQFALAQSVTNRNGLYLAECSPDAILALLDRLDSATAVLKVTEDRLTSTLTGDASVESLWRLRGDLSRARALLDEEGSQR